MRSTFLSRRTFPPAAPFFGSTVAPLDDDPVEGISNVLFSFGGTASIGARAQGIRGTWLVRHEETAGRQAVVGAVHKGDLLPLGFLSHFWSTQVARTPGFSVFLLLLQKN